MSHPLLMFSQGHAPDRPTNGHLAILPPLPPSSSSLVFLPLRPPSSSSLVSLFFLPLLVSSLASLRPSGCADSSVTPPLPVSPGFTSDCEATAVFMYVGVKILAPVLWKPECWKVPCIYTTSALSGSHGSPDLLTGNCNCIYIISFFYLSGTRSA